MNYPGRIIKLGESDAAVVRTIAVRLNQVLALPPGAEGALKPKAKTFDAAMQRAVKLFQARNVDRRGVPLQQDGKIGSLTWEALFDAQPVTALRDIASPLFAEALRRAAAEEAAKVREVPTNSNRGPRVEQFLARVDCPPGNAWCCAFVYWCVDEASHQVGVANPLVRTAGCLDHWNRAPSRGAVRVTKQQGTDDPSLIHPGMIFIMDHGSGLGHTGLIEEVAGGVLTTIEGNTDASKTREGGGVYRLTRKVSEINKGYIDYTGT